MWNASLRDTSQIPYVIHHVIMLGDCPGDSDDVRLLESVITDHGGWDLTGKSHQRDRVHERVCNAGHKIGSPGTGRGETDPHLARRPRIAFCSMNRAGLVPRQDVPNSIPLHHLVNGAAV